MFDSAVPSRLPAPLAVFRPRLVGELAVAGDDAALLRAAFAPGRPSAAVIEHLCDAARLVRCGPGPLNLSSPRRPEPSWWLLRRGSIALGTREAGKPLVERRTIGPGEWLETAGAMANPGRWLEAAECRSDVELIAVPVAAMNEACAIDPDFAQAYACVLALRVRDLHERLDDLVSADVPARVARWLLRQLTAEQRAASSATLVLSERKRLLARTLGMSSESFSRALRRLIDAGLVQVHGYRLVLTDINGLQRVGWPEAPAAAGS